MLMRMPCERRRCVGRYFRVHRRHVRATLLCGEWKMMPYARHKRE